MQSYADKNIVPRLLYYWSRDFSRQLLKSEVYNTLNPVISICFTTELIFSRLPKQHNCFLLKEQDPAVFVLSDLMQLHIIELAKRGKKSPCIRLLEWMEYIYMEKE